MKCLNKIGICKKHFLLSQQSNLFFFYWQNLDFLLSQHQGGFLRPRISSSLISRETPNSVFCTVRWLPTNGVSQINISSAPVVDGPTNVAHNGLLESTFGTDKQNSIYLRSAVALYQVFKLIQRSWKMWNILHSVTYIKAYLELTQKFIILKVKVFHTNVLVYFFSRT